MRPRLRSSLGVPTGDCQPQGTASSRGSPGPRLTPPPLGKLLLAHGRSLRCVTVCASVSVSDRMPSSLPCLSPIFRLSVSRSVSPSLCLCLPVPVCFRACARPRARLSVCLSVRISLPSSSSLSLNLRLFLPLSLLTPCRPSVPLAPPLTGVMALAEELAPAGCLPLRGCVRVSGRLSVSVLPVACLLSQEGRVPGRRCGGKGALGRAKGRG